MTVLRETTFSVPKMDCPSEEQMIRMALASLSQVEELHVDLSKRQIVVVHSGDSQPVYERLEKLRLGARFERTEETTTQRIALDPEAEARVLRQLLWINGGMFVVELVLGLIAASTGLLADALDMLADAMVYSISLYAVGRAVADQRRAARASGALQLVLALGVLFEVARRATMGHEPVDWLIIGVASLALVANLACVALLSRHREGGVHLQASWIFTTNDALANVAVIVAGLLVMWTGSAVPDLVAGAGVGLLVLSGAVRILRLP